MKDQRINNNDDDDASIKGFVKRHQYKLGIGALVFVAIPLTFLFGYAIPFLVASALIGATRLWVDNDHNFSAALKQHKTELTEQIADLEARLEKLLSMVGEKSVDLPNKESQSSSLDLSNDPNVSSQNSDEKSQSNNPFDDHNASEFDPVHAPDTKDVHDKGHEHEYDDEVKEAKNESNGNQNFVLPQNANKRSESLKDKKHPPKTSTNSPDGTNKRFIRH